MTLFNDKYMFQFIKKPSDFTLGKFPKLYKDERAFIVGFPFRITLNIYKSILRSFIKYRFSNT